MNKQEIDGKIAECIEDIELHKFNIRAGKISMATSKNELKELRRMRKTIKNERNE